jgi:hypothetical protein
MFLGFETAENDLSRQSDRIKTLTRKLALRAEETNKVLFDGRWLSAEEAVKRYRRLEWESRLKVAEMVLLFFFAIFVLMIPVAILKGLGGIPS